MSNEVGLQRIAKTEAAAWPDDDYYGRKHAACPNKEQHQRGPKGLDDWHAWAARMSRTHKQRRCDDCGFWWIWEARNV